MQRDSSSMNFKDYLIIVGFPRSGTTMLRSYLSNYEELCVHEIEPHWIQEFFQKFGVKQLDASKIKGFLKDHPKFPANQRWNRINISDRDLQILFEDGLVYDLKTIVKIVFGFLFKDQNPNEKTLVLKHPNLIFSSQTPGLLQYLFNPGKVKIIHIIRNPKAAIASYISRWRNTGMKSLSSLWARAFYNGNSLYSKNSFSFTNVKYEDLLADPQGVITHLFYVLEIDVSVKEFVFKKRVREWDRETKKKKFVTLEGFDATKNNKWTTTLSSDEAWLIEYYLRQEMSALNYELTEKQIPEDKKILLLVKDGILSGFFNIKSNLKSILRRN